MIDSGDHQGRRGPTAEGSRAITESILLSIWRSSWPLWVLFGLWILCGVVFA